MKLYCVQDTAGGKDFVYYALNKESTLAVFASHADAQAWIDSHSEYKGLVVSVVESPLAPIPTVDNGSVKQRITETLGELYDLLNEIK